MYSDLISILLAFLEGFALIISPCILPILPIILSGSLESGKKRPFGIITGFIATFVVFTYFSKKLVEYSGIDLTIVRNASLIILLLLGIVMLSSHLTNQFAKLTRGLNTVGQDFKMANQYDGGFFSGVLFGALIGLIWTPCAGPILAAVIVQTVIQKTTYISLLTLCSFALGAAIPMLIIALLGRQILQKFSYFGENAYFFRKILGVIIIASVAYIYLASGASASLPYTSSSQKISGATLIHGLDKPYAAPEISGIQNWINSPAIDLQKLKGKVVLIDFWAYSCINCIRTLPYLKNWYAQYHDKGLVIIGVHSPEFDFERKFENVQASVIKNNIQYPVALDNYFVTWQNFKNQYWPAHYLIDKEGNVVYEHFGEGDYDTTENNIRYLLGLHQDKMVEQENEIHSIRQSPETYLGYNRANEFKSPEAVLKESQTQYSYPRSLSTDEWALSGAWIISGDKITSDSKNTGIRMHFVASKVFMVMGTQTNKPIHVKVLLNNTFQNNLTVDHHDLYTILQFNKVEEGIVEVIADEPGLEIFTFTFG
ncbi:MAG: cytochrome c biogenesis protein CcdA [Gammaproteobacteria bacterium]|nr:cytochrome c biogenesis protein CcdA [Gammaproteobacteria bacterium]